MNDYDKKVKEAPYQPGYEDAVINPTPKKYLKELNAYELADALDDFINPSWEIKESQTMLRKQADRIKELETKYKQEFDYVEYLLKERKK